MTKRWRSCWVMAAVLAVGLLLRLYALAPYANGPSMYADDNGYLLSAVNFLHTGYLSYNDLSGQSSAICVGLPALLSLLLKIFGYTSQGLWLAHVAFSCIGLLSALAVYALLKNLVSERAGWLGAALCAWLPDMVSVNCFFCTETPYLCLNLFALYHWIRCVRRWSVGRYIAGTVCMLCACSFKGLGLLAVVAPLAMLLYAKVPLRQWLPKAAITVMAFVLAFSPWWLRNEKLLGQFVPFTSNRGDIQLLGTYQGIGYPEGDYASKVTELDAEAWAEGYEADGVRRFARRGEVGRERMAQWLRENPAGFLITHFLYNPLKLTLMRGADIRLIPERLADLIWWGSLLLALWGLLCPRFGAKVNRGYYAPAVYLLVATLVTAFYVPLTRYGEAQVPLWLMYAAAGAWDILSRAKGRKKLFCN